MREEFMAYILMLINGIPQSVYEGALSILCFGFVVLFAWKGKNSGRYIARLAFLEYTVLIYCSTVLFRTTNNVRKYDFQLFWSYNNPSLFVENAMNVVVFIPIGLLIGIAFKYTRWWQALLAGAFLSVSIEALQFVFKKGFSEVDDVMHNTLGCLIGYGVYEIARYEYERIFKRNWSFQDL